MSTPIHTKQVYERIFWCRLSHFGLLVSNKFFRSP